MDTKSTPSTGSNRHRTNRSAVFAQDEIHDRWVSAYRDNPLQDSFNELIMDTLVGLWSPEAGARVLDAGCGTGTHSVRLAKRGLHVVGVDISPSVVETAGAAASKSGVAKNTTFLSGRLENLAEFKDGEFDFIHCRGVLMHIPDWQAALKELCRVLKPGGQIFIMENNDKALEYSVVRLVRMFRKSSRKIVVTDGGVEFHPDDPESEPLTRIANTDYLTEFLADHGVRTTTRFASEFWDIARWPAGPIRNTIVRFNRFWFSYGLSPRLSLGNALVGRKDADAFEKRGNRLGN